ncbi:MAG: hypothetical protein GF329_15870 [Candidatus Lokiarchaeota archaeon]|nr:hypothetical protein [Candidatus Lokiarchaeota archaeon]
MPTSKGEGGSWLYGIILMVAGGFVVLTGILNFFGFNPITDWLPTELKYLAGTISFIYIGIGGWGIISGIGLIKDQEWAWGIALVVLSLVIIAFAADVVIGLMAAFQTWNFTDINLWIKLVILIVAAVGIVYLLLTKEKYA